MTSIYTRNPGGTGTGTAAPRGYDPAYGGVPNVPNFIDVYGKTLGANQANLPSLTKTAGEITGAQEEVLLNNLRRALPGYDTSVAKSMGNIGSLQKGEIPLDVRNLLAQQGAERGIATGLYDSPNANAALMRAMGLTSLGLQGEGEKQMTSLVGRTPQAQPYDVSKLFMNPTDLYESELLRNIYAAAPVPKAAAQQLISDQMGAYNIGKQNVPSYSSVGGMPNLSTPPNINRSEPIPTALGALGPFPKASTAKWSLPTGNLEAGGGHWVYDASNEAYYNTRTGQYADTPGGTPWEGLSWGGINSPTADNAIDWSQVPTVPGGEWQNEEEFYGGI